MGIEKSKEKRKEKMPTEKQTVRERAIPARIEKEIRIAPDKLDLLITVVDRKKAEYYIDLIQSFDVNMEVEALARGMAAKMGLLEYLGIADSEKAVIFSFVREDKTNELMDTLEDKFRSIKGGKGISVSISFSSVIGKLVYGFLSNNEKTIQEEKRQ